MVNIEKHVIFKSKRYIPAGDELQWVYDECKKNVISTKNHGLFVSIEENLPLCVKREILIMDYQYKNLGGDARIYIYIWEEILNRRLDIKEIYINKYNNNSTSFSSMRNQVYIIKKNHN
jgi:hypothetical protein